MGEGVDGQYGRAHEITPAFCFIPYGYIEAPGSSDKRTFGESEGCQNYIRCWLDLDSDVRIIFCIERLSAPESMNSFHDPPDLISQPSAGLGV